MTVDDFKAADATTLSGPLLALWHDGHGDWARAHQVAQDIDDIDDPNGAWVHAYLHRKEGDTANAAYWYRRAARPIPRISLDAEWHAMVRELLTAQP